MNQQFDKELGWVPAIPMAFSGQGWFGIGKYLQCECGKRFKGKHRRTQYEAHYALTHLDGSDAIQRRELDEARTKLYASDIEGVSAFLFIQEGGKSIKISEENMRELGFGWNIGMDA